LQGHNLAAEADPYGMKMNVCLCSADQPEGGSGNFAFCSLPAWTVQTAIVMESKAKSAAAHVRISAMRGTKGLQKQSVKREITRHWLRMRKYLA
jgi:hypothetical protein